MTRGPETTLFAEEHAYDSVPYASYPIFQASPARLAAIGTIYGLQTPLVESARVLELGCAAGGHLIGLAAAYPHAHFLGVDISGVQIREGQARIAALGLTNIELRKQSLTDLHEQRDSFDYIISHGLFSWVPDAVRTALLRISHDCLRTGGLAFVSFNALPGWHLKRVIRDILVYHTELAPDDRSSLVGAREILAAVAPFAEKAYGSVVAAEIAEAETSADYFLKHDYLERENTAFTFADFMKYAHENGLRYVSDADTMGTLPDGFTRADLFARLGEAAKSPLRFEQYLDYLSGRMFRMAVLTKALDTAPSGAVVPERFADIHFRCVPLKLREAGHEHEPLHVVLAEIEQLRAANTTDFEQYPVTVRALEILLRSTADHPSTFTLYSLTSEACGGTAPTDADLLLVQNLVVEMFERRMLHIYAHEIHACRSAERPTVSPLIRHDAHDKRDATTNRFHEKVPLNRLDFAMLPLFDGSRSEAELAAAFAEVRNTTVDLHNATTFAELLASYNRVRLLS